MSEAPEAAFMFVFICHITECKFLDIIGPERVEVLKNQSLTASRTSPPQLSPPPRCWCTNRLWNFWIQLKLYREGQLTGMTGRLGDAAKADKKERRMEMSFVLLLLLFFESTFRDRKQSSLEKWRKKVISPFSTDIWPGPSEGGGDFKKDSSIMSKERHSSSSRSSQSLIVCGQGRNPNTDFNRS